MAKNNIDKIITESINKILNEKLVDTFTPYTPEQAKANREAMVGMGKNNRPLEDRNKSYGDFIAWRREGLANGIPSIQLSWDNYLKLK